MNRKATTECDIIRALASGDLLLPPLKIRLIQSELMVGLRKIDALAEVSWNNHVSLFGLEIKALSTPKAFQSVTDQILSVDLPTGTLPMIVLPYLKEENLRNLEKRGISGIDMCGNGVVISGSFRVFRSGQPNRFRTSAAIKNVYARNSSMVARAFLYKPSYPTVQAICTEINKRNPLVKSYGRKEMSLSTVSKCLKTLVEDLAVNRADSIDLLQARKLLDELSGNYKPPIREWAVTCNIAGTTDPISAIANAASSLNMPMILSGLSSVSRYAVMQRGATKKIYCPDLSRLLKQLPIVQTERFPDIEFIETSEEALYFDSREAQGVSFASSVQTYLELMAGDKRDIETALQVQDFIMSELEGIR